MTYKVKYPRTMHVPHSLGATSDDKILKSIDHLLGKECVITEKMDGECSSLYKNTRHARSLDSTHHFSRNWLANFHSTISYLIPDDYRICGEYLYARHSIAYDELPSYFLAFSVWSNQLCLEWDTTVEYLNSINVNTVPVLFRGILTHDVLKEIEKNLNYEKQEGYVIRLASSFYYDEFSSSVCKYVRANHVCTDDHWMYKQIIPNKLKS